MVLENQRKTHGLTTFERINYQIVADLPRGVALEGGYDERLLHSRHGFKNKLLTGLVIFPMFRCNAVGIYMSGVRPNADFI